MVRKAGTNNPGVPTGPRLSGLVITYREVEEVSGCREPRLVSPSGRDRTTRLWLCSLRNLSGSSSGKKKMGSGR